MRIQTGQLVSLGYGRYVRSDEVVAVEPITEGRDPGRRCLVWVRGVPDPIVASRSQASIIDEMTTPAESATSGTGASGHAAARRARPAAASPSAKSTRGRAQGKPVPRRRTR
jgi:hypothetical protein